MLVWGCWWKIQGRIYGIGNVPHDESVESFMRQASSKLIPKRLISWDSDYPLVRTKFVIWTPTSRSIQKFIGALLQYLALQLQWLPKIFCSKLIVTHKINSSRMKDKAMSSHNMMKNHKEINIICIIIIVVISF